MYSSYDASTVVRGGSAAKVIGVAALAAQGDTDQVTLVTSYDAAVSDGRLMDLVIRERMIELYMEGHNFWDLRRWMETSELNDPLYGWNVVAEDAEGFYNNWQGPMVVWSLRGFQAPRDYFWPISSKELMTSGVVQNPGW